MEVLRSKPEKQSYLVKFECKQGLIVETWRKDWLSNIKTELDDNRNKSLLQFIENFKLLDILTQKTVEINKELLES